LPEIIFETDLNGNLTFLNKNSYQRSGYTKEDLEKGLNALQLMIPKDREGARKRMEKILAGEKPSASEYTAFNKRW